MLTPRKPSGREKDEAAVERLAELREKLHSDDINVARQAAFHLSWMQEDGLEILAEALLGDFPRTAKKAATYGLRNMHGRMKTLGEAVLTRGLTHANRTTRDACSKAIYLMKGGNPKRKGGPRGKRPAGRHGVREIRSRNRGGTRSRRRSRPSNR
jgi:hypothetical protein